MNITFILKDSPEKLPPILPRVMYLARCGHNVRFISTSIANSVRNLFEDVGVECKTTEHCTKIFGTHSRLADWLGFKSGCKKLLQNTNSEDELLYICSADTALCLNTLLKGKKYFFQSNELYDGFPIYRYGIKRYIMESKAFIVPEFCRANICKLWYRTNTPSYVIPNVPYIVSRKKNQKLHSAEAENIISEIAGKKILIYQGHIKNGDRSVDAVARALAKINNAEYVLLLMGTEYDNSVATLKKIYSQTYHIPFVAAPYHLEITSYAHIGLLSYDRTSLNNIFCAPNKLYEYSALALPMLGNDIPGLKYTIEGEKMGACADFEDVDAVADAILSIENNYDDLACNAGKFFDRENIENKIDALMENLDNERENRSETQK